jgi:hypothetical protein
MQHDEIARSVCLAPTGHRIAIRYCFRQDARPAHQSRSATGNPRVSAATSHPSVCAIAQSFLNEELRSPRSRPPMQLPSMFARYAKPSCLLVIQEMTSLPLCLVPACHFCLHLSHETPLKPLLLLRCLPLFAPFCAAVATRRFSRVLLSKFLSLWSTCSLSP